MKKGLSRLVTSKRNPGNGAVRLSPGVYRQAAPQKAPQAQPMPQQMQAPQPQQMAIPRPIANGPQQPPMMGAEVMPQQQMGKQWIRR